MRKLMVVLVLGAVMGAMAPATVRAGNEAAEKQAIAAAQAWLALVDAGKFAESWETAAAMFRAAVTKADWVRMVGAVRTPLGNVVSRKLKAKQFTTTLPGAPDGQYVVIQFDTGFEHKAAAAEMITPMLDKDGSWRVCGYFIR
jgi:hypothetical protein